MNDLDSDELRELRDELHENYGIFFPEKKYYQLEAKIKKRMRKLGLDSLSQYRPRLMENVDELSSFLDTVSTNTTRFYREPAHWEFYRSLLNGDWRDRTSLKLWSVAASTGEEPYTLAILTEEFFKEYNEQSFTDNAYRILATDLSESALSTAIQGTYSKKTLTKLSERNPVYVSRYFNQVGDNRYQVKDEIRDRVTFRKFNLKSEDYHYTNTFDLILVRNVLIYFDREMMEHVISNVTRCLKPGGYLFVGHSESLNSIDHTLEKVQPAIYKKT